MPDSTEEGVGARRPSKKLVQALDRWRRELIDVGGRNPLIYFKDLKQGTLDLAGGDPDAQRELLEGNVVRLSALFPTLELRKAALSKCRVISKKAQERFEEWGLTTLYLVDGFATWTPKGGV